MALRPPAQPRLLTPRKLAAANIRTPRNHTARRRIARAPNLPGRKAMRPFRERVKRVGRFAQRYQAADGTPFSGRLDRDQADIERRLGVPDNFDVLTYRWQVGSSEALIVTIDGFVQEDVLLRITQYMMKAADEHDLAASILRLSERGVGFVEVGYAFDQETLVDAVLAGQAAFLFDGLTVALLVDTRTYPGREPQEPDTEKTLRGSRDGFTETMLQNITLVRRRLRDPQLRFEVMAIGARSKTDVAIAYIQDIANPELVELVKKRLREISIDAMPMADRPLVEYLSPQQRWWNPFPTVRFTERPDVTAAHLVEGHVVLLPDTTPHAVIVPVSFFHHLQHAQEYKQTPLTGTYLRWLRFIGLLLAWFGPGLWLGFVMTPALRPAFLDFIGTSEAAGPIPIGLQFVIAEVASGLIWVSVMNSPNSFATGIGIIGAILLGEQAIEVGLFTSEALLYIALAFIGTMATPSIELGNTIRVLRFLLLLFTAAGGMWGFLIGSAAMLILLARTRSLGVPYLYPLWPFRARELMNLIIRRPISAKNLRPLLTKPQDVTRQDNM